MRLLIHSGWMERTMSIIKPPNNMKKIIRQGDIALIAVRAIKNATKVEDNVIARGEVSGHHHRVVGDAQLVEKNGQMYILSGSGRAYLAHLKESDMSQADHLPLELKPDTTYLVKMQ